MILFLVLIVNDLRTGQYGQKSSPFYLSVQFNIFLSRKHLYSYGLHGEHHPDCWVHPNPNYQKAIITLFNKKNVHVVIIQST